jgi:predicted O-methyltransferase YrrM
MQGTELRKKIADDVHHDVDMHTPWLESVAKGNILEIGVRTGISTSAFLSGLEANGGHLYSVDINADCKQAIGSHPNWTFICADSQKPETLLHQLAGLHFDILFLDGDHSYEGVKNDFANYAPLVKSGGRIICHDVLSGYDPGVRKAFDEYIDATKFEAEIFTSWVGLGQILVP